MLYEFGGGGGHTPLPLSCYTTLICARSASLFSLLSSLVSFSLSLSLSRLYVSSAGWLLAARLSFVSLVVCV